MPRTATNKRYIHNMCAEMRAVKIYITYHILAAILPMYMFSCCLSSQDLSGMMGWPAEELDWGNLGERCRRSLIGEGIHVACSAAVLMAIYVEFKAPWWEGIENTATSAGSQDAAASSSAQAKKRARRTGAIAPASSRSF